MSLSESAYYRKTFTRSEILERLQASIDAGRPILGAGCSAGIIAKNAERGGADFIVAYSTGRSRLMGLPTSQLGQPNPQTLGMIDEIANVVNDTPIVGGAHAIDPTYRLGPLLDAFMEAGFDGIIPFPSAGKDWTKARDREHVGQGMGREADLIRLARNRDVFTVVYAYSREQGEVLTRAGADVVIAHAGWTAGGTVGAGSHARSMEQSVDFVNDVARGVWAINPDTICLAHGGAIATPEDTQRLYEMSPVQGFVGASSIERLPIEEAIKNAVRGFKEPFTDSRARRAETVPVSAAS